MTPRLNTCLGCLVNLSLSACGQSVCMNSLIRVYRLIGGCCYRLRTFLLNFVTNSASMYAPKYVGFGCGCCMLCAERRVTIYKKFCHILVFQNVTRFVTRVAKIEIVAGYR